MFATSGFFRGLNCPHYARGPGRTCRRPYCHFRHVRRDNDSNKTALTSSSISTEKKPSENNTQDGKNKNKSSKSDYASTSLPNWKKKSNKPKVGSIKRRGTSELSATYVPTPPLAQFQKKTKTVTSEYDGPYGHTDANHDEYDPANAALGSQVVTSGKYSLESDDGSYRAGEYMPTGSRATCQKKSSDKYSYEPEVHGCLEYDPLETVDSSTSEKSSKQDTSSKYQDTLETSSGQKYTIERGPVTDLEYDPLENSSLDAVQASSDNTQRYIHADGGGTTCEEYDPVGRQKPEETKNSAKYSLGKQTKSDISVLYGVDEYDPMENINTPDENNYEYSPSEPYSYSATSSVDDMEYDPSSNYSTDVMTSKYLSSAKDSSSSQKSDQASLQKRKASSDISEVHNKKLKPGSTTPKKDSEDDLYNWEMDAWFSEDDDESAHGNYRVNDKDDDDDSDFDDDHHLVIDLDAEKSADLPIPDEKSNKSKEQVQLYSKKGMNGDQKKKMSSEKQSSHEMSETCTRLDKSNSTNKKEIRDESTQGSKIRNGALCNETGHDEKQKCDDYDDIEIGQSANEGNTVKINEEHREVVNSAENKEPAKIVKPQVSSEQLANFFNKRLHPPATKQNKKNLSAGRDNIFNRISKSLSADERKTSSSGSKNKESTDKKDQKDTVKEKNSKTGNTSKDTPSKVIGNQSKDLITSKSTTEKSHKASVSKDKVKHKQQVAEKEKLHTDDSKVSKSVKLGASGSSGSKNKSGKDGVKKNRSEVSNNSKASTDDRSGKNALSKDKSQMKKNSKSFENDASLQKSNSYKPIVGQSSDNDAKANKGPSFGEKKSSNSPKETGGSAKRSKSSLELFGSLSESGDEPPTSSKPNPSIVKPSSVRKDPSKKNSKSACDLSSRSNKCSDERSKLVSNDKNVMGKTPKQLHRSHSVGLHSDGRQTESRQTESQVSSKDVYELSSSSGADVSKINWTMSKGKKLTCKTYLKKHRSLSVAPQSAGKQVKSHSSTKHVHDLSSSSDSDESHRNRAVSKGKKLTSRTHKVMHRSHSWAPQPCSGNSESSSVSTTRKLSEQDLFGEDSSEETQADEDDVIFVKKTSKDDIKPEVIDLLSSGESGDDEEGSMKSSKDGKLGSKKSKKEGHHKHSVRSSESLKHKHRVKNSKSSTHKNSKVVKSCKSPSGENDALKSKKEMPSQVVKNTSKESAMLRNAQEGTHNIHSSTKKPAKDNQAGKSKVKKDRRIQKDQPPADGVGKDNQADKWKVEKDRHIKKDQPSAHGVKSKQNGMKKLNKHRKSDRAITDHVESSQGRQKCVNRGDSDTENYAMCDDQMDIGIPSDYHMNDTDISFSETDTYEECLKIFNETTVTLNDTKKKKQAPSSSDEAEDIPLHVVVGKQRVAHAPKFDTSRMRKVIKRPMAQPSPSQVCHNRFLIVQEEAKKRAEQLQQRAQDTTQSSMDRKRVAHTPSYVPSASKRSSLSRTTSTSSNRASGSRPSSPSITHSTSPYVSPKRRIMEKKFAAVHRANSGWEVPGKTLAITAEKSGKRIAHVPTKVGGLFAGIH